MSRARRRRARGGSVARIIAALSAAAAVLVLGAAAALGVRWVGGHVLPWLLKAAEWTFVVDAVVLVPLSIVPASRRAAAGGFFGSAWYFGLSAWALGLVTAYGHWGVPGLSAGLAFGGVGVVPVAMAAAAAKADWPALTSLIGACVLWLAALGMGLFLQRHTPTAGAETAADPELAAAEARLARRVSLLRQIARAAKAATQAAAARRARIAAEQMAPEEGPSARLGARGLEALLGARTGTRPYVAGATGLATPAALQPAPRPAAPPPTSEPPAEEKAA